jgi:hypothetical protein
MAMEGRGGCPSTTPRLPATDSGDLFLTTVEIPQESAENPQERMINPMSSKPAGHSAGDRLRADLDRALSRAAHDQGLAALEFSDIEKGLIESAVDMADWTEKLKTMRDAELAGQARPTTLIRLSAEVRHCERQVHDLVDRVNFGVGVAKSAQHQRAGQARWNRGSTTVRPSRSDRGA